MSMTVRKQFIILALIVSAVVLGSPLYGQEPFSAEGIPAGSDFVYRKQYDQVQEIMKTPDLAQREQKLTAYYQKLQPEAKIREYMEAYFGQILEEYQKKGMTAQANALTQKMLKWFPKSDALLGQQLKTAYDGKNWSKVIEVGEKMRATAPNDVQVLAMLTQAYQSTNNNAKVLELAPKLVDALGPKKAINYVVFLGDQYRQKNDTANARKYYNMALQAYPTTPPDGWKAAQWNAVKEASYQLSATAAWNAQNWPAVIKSYQEVLKLDPQNDGAYLGMGLAYWKQQELDAAQAAFAKAVVLNKTTAAKARQYLEQLYKPRNNNSLDGLDQVLAKAKAELGV